MAIEYTFDPSRIDLDELWRLLRATYWSPNIRRDVVERAVRNSVVNAALEIHQGGPPRLVGFARAVTDRATFAWLCDVVVVEDRRGRGIGTALVKQLIAHPELQTLRRWSLATRDAHGVYAPLGFTPVPAERWMEKRMDPAGWSDASPTSH